MRPTSVLLSLLPLALAGCLFSQMTPASKLREAVQDGNEAARWGRLDIAMEKVATSYVREYARRHHDWGTGIQLADLDIERMQMAEDENTATVVVAFSWYDYDTMTLERTVVRQKWTSLSAGGFVLAEEEVIDGNERLLEPPEDPEEEEAADDEEEAVAAADDADDDADDEAASDEWVEEEGEAVTELARAEP